jgi:hypothetical protein
MMIRAMAALFLVGIALIGCSADHERKGTEPSATDNEPRVKKFLSSTDRLVIKHFFNPIVITDPLRGQYTTPGRCELGPVVVYEPGKEKDRIKGVRIEISSTYVRVNEYSKADSGTSLLDLQEAQDLDNSLSYMAQTEQDWKRNRPTDDIEVTFTSKDDFTAALLPNSKADILYLHSQRIGGATVSLPVSMLGELQTKLRQSISTLEAN